jgi:hypothetical protein
MLAQGLIAQGQLVLDAVIHSPGDADSSSISQSFHTGRDIDPIPVDPLSLLHHISKVNPNAELHSTVFRQFCVPHPEFLLDLHSTTDRIHYTAKFGQKVVPRGVHHPASMLLNECGHQLPIGRQGPDRRILILAHEAAVPFNIRTEDGGEFTFKFLLVHEITPLKTKAPKRV